MTQLPKLSNLLPSLHTSSVRDLAWTILSPRMLATTQWPQRHPLSASGWIEAPQDLAAWLHALDRDATPLLTWLGKSSVRRLGLYYERLWQFAIEHAPGVEMVAVNLPIRLEGRTLGELDMLLRDKDGVHHVELAIKLYLGPEQENGLDPVNWLGPGCQDRLGRKLQHLNEHQLPMSARPESRQALTALGIDGFSTELWLGGYLFYPWSAACLAPEAAAADHLRGTWVHQKDWPDFVRQRPAGHWQPLPRPSWLSPARFEQVCSTKAVEQWRQALDPLARAQLLVRLVQHDNGHWEEAERAFLVADAWPNLVDGGAITGPIPHPADTTQTL